MNNLISLFLMIFICTGIFAQEQITNSGNIKIHPGTTLSFFGNFTNNGSYLDSGISAQFIGNGNQIISGSEETTFKNLEINNPSGLILQQSVIVSNDLNLLTGALDLNSKTLTIDNTSSSAINRINGYIISEQTNNSGKIKWNIGNELDLYIFPFGNTSGDYIPFIMNHISGDIGNVTVSTYQTDENNIPYPTSPVAVNNMFDTYGNDNSTNTVDRFWQIDKDGSGGIATLTFNSSPTETGPIANLVAQRWNTLTNAWESPLPDQTCTPYSATVPNVSNFSPWTLTGNGSSLPVTLMSFTVQKKNTYAELIWITVTETNNYGYDVEKSTDSYEWVKIGFVKGTGNSNIFYQYSYNDLLTENISKGDTTIYYRLKQIDFDGKFSYSELKSVNLSSLDSNKPTVFDLFPNPASEYFNIISNQPENLFEVKIYNEVGSIVRSFTMENRVRLDISDMKPSAYVIIIFDLTNGNQYQFTLIKMPGKSM